MIVLFHQMEKTHFGIEIKIIHYIQSWLSSVKKLKKSRPTFGNFSRLRFGIPDFSAHEFNQKHVLDVYFNIKSISFKKIICKLT
jgi:hypothetical protein